MKKTSLYPLVVACLLIIGLSTISCKKNKELKEHYENYKGKWFWYQSEYSQAYGGGTTQIFDQDYYVYEFLEDFKVKIWSYNSILLEGELIDMEIADVSFEFNISGNDGGTYKSDFHKIDDDLWSRSGGPGPKSPVSVIPLQNSYFKKIE